MRPTAAAARCLTLGFNVPDARGCIHICGSSSPVSVSLPPPVPLCPSLTLCLDTRTEARAHVRVDGFRLALSSLPMAKQRAAAVINHAVSRGSCGARHRPPRACRRRANVRCEQNVYLSQDFIRQSAHSAHCRIDLATRGQAHKHTLTPPHTLTLFSLFSSFGNKSCRGAVKASRFYYYGQTEEPFQKRVCFMNVDM